MIHGRRILLVDDDPLILEISEDRLLRAGASVFSATGIQLALELARAEQPEFILLDLTIGDSVVTPDLVGELQACLHVEGRRTILHSAVSATELYRQAHALCALGAIQKTGDERIFLHRMQRLLELSQAITHGATDRPSVPY